MTEDRNSIAVPTGTSPKGPFEALARLGRAFVDYVAEDPTAPYSSAKLSAIDGAMHHAVPPSQLPKLTAQ